MRWSKKLPETPKLGDIRSTLKFAWLPVTTTKGTTRIWLELYWVHEEYQNQYPAIISQGYWDITCIEVYDPRKTPPTLSG